MAGIHDRSRFHHHADRVQMANIAKLANVLKAMILTDGPRMLRTPTYHVFEMFGPVVGTMLASPAMNAQNSFDQPDAITA